MVDMDAQYSLHDSELKRFNVRAYSSVTNTIRTSAEFRYRANDSSLLSADMTLFPYRDGWSPSMFARYEFEESRLEEAGIYLRRTYDCIVYRTGFRLNPGYTRTDGSKVDDEYSIMFEFWLRAFPEYGVKRKSSEYSREDILY